MDGKILKPRRREFTKLEKEILEFYSSILILLSRPAFNDDDLASQLATCLEKNGLVDGPLRTLPDGLKKFVALYALEKMHLARIVLPGGKTALLTACLHAESYDKPDLLSIDATVIAPWADKETEMMFSVYTTSLEGEQWCEPDLLPAPPRKGAIFKFPLEIGSAGKLQMLQ